MSTDPEHSELQNGSQEPESEPLPQHEPSAAAAAAAPDLQQPDPSDTDAQPPDAEGSGEVLPVNAEPSNSAPEGEISIELSDADSRPVNLNQDGDSDSKAEENRTFTMRELLNELKNGDGNVNDGRESGTPHRSVDCSVNVLGWLFIFLTELCSTHCNWVEYRRDWICTGCEFNVL